MGFCTAPKMLVCLGPHKGRRVGRDVKRKTLDKDDLKKGAQDMVLVDDLLQLPRVLVSQWRYLLDSRGI